MSSLDDPWVRGFEALTLDPADFHHREHLWVAWCYLSALPLEDALARYAASLRRFAAAAGVPEKYHATMTWGWMLLLDEAMSQAPGAEFDALLALRPALLDRALLEARWDPAVLASEEARRRFVLPGRP